jgi:hypothetical protein
VYARAMAVRSGRSWRLLLTGTMRLRAGRYTLTIAHVGVRTIRID